MQKSLLNFTIDLASLLAGLGMVATGMILRWVLPPGTGGRQAL